MVTTCNKPVAISQMANKSIPRFFVRFNFHLLRRSLMASPSSAQTMRRLEPLAIVAEKIHQLEALAIEESPFNSDAIAGLKCP